MSQPYFTLTITAGTVAWYAAIVSTVNSAIQFANYLRDRVRVKLTVQKNMETVNDPVHDGMSLTMFKVTNTGRRPVTITNVGMMYLHNKGAIFTDTVPRIPCELTEGKFITTLVDQSALRFGEIRYFVAYDAVGREYRSGFAPRHRRVYWWFRRKFSKEKQSKNSGPGGTQG